MKTIKNRRRITIPDLFNFVFNTPFSLKLQKFGGNCRGYFILGRSWWAKHGFPEQKTCPGF
jgi:hypothetical protein